MAGDIFIHHGKHFIGPIITRLVMHKIDSPHMVRPIGKHTKFPQLCRNNFPQFSVFGDGLFYASVLISFLSRPRFWGGSGGVIGD